MKAIHRYRIYIIVAIYIVSIACMFYPSYQRGRKQARINNLITALNNSDWRISRQAARDLGNIGPDANQAVLGLISKLDDPTVGTSAVEALVKICDGDDNIVDILVNRVKTSDLNNTDSSILSGAILQAMETIGPKVLPRIGEIITDKTQNKDVKLWAIAVVANMGPKAFSAVPWLLDALDSDDKQIKLHSLWALGEIGEAAKDALPKIEMLAQSSKDEDILDATRKAIAKINAN